MDLSYLQVEEMKGKIRVFCRVRPVNELERRREGGEQVAAADDHYTLTLNTQRGHKSFLFDRVFHPHDDQEAVFHDTNVCNERPLFDLFQFLSTMLPHVQSFQ